MYQTLEEFILSLSPEERKHFIEVDLPKLLMNQSHSVLKRTTLKLSTDLPEIEIRKAISETMDIPLERVPKFDFNTEKVTLKNESNEVNAIIKNYKAKLDISPNVTADKYDELYDLGKFILFANNNFKIEVPNPILKFPDFVISHQNNKIGLEHTRLMNEEAKAIIKTAKYYIKKAEEIVAKKLSHLSKTVNIFIDYNQNVIDKSNFKNRQFSPTQKKELIHSIADFINSELTGGNSPKPNFINQIKITSNNDSRVDLELAESYYTTQEFTNILLERIQRKETRVANYRNESNLDVIWLLIIIDDVSSFSGFDLKIATFPKIEISNFDRIFLFEKFGGKIYTLYQNHSI